MKSVKLTRLMFMFDYLFAVWSNIFGIISVYVKKRYRMYEFLFVVLILSIQFYMKLEEKLHVKEAEINQMQTISQVSRRIIASDGKNIWIDELTFLHQWNSEPTHILF